MAFTVALFVSKRFMPVAAALLILASARLAHIVSSSPEVAMTATPTSEVRVLIAR